MITQVSTPMPATDCIGALLNSDSLERNTQTAQVHRTSSRDECERIFLSQLPAIDRIVSAVARKSRLRADEIDEFASLVHLRIVSDHYAVLRRFQGNCAWRTYLTIVIQRMFLDYRNTQWGRWRPSAKSRGTGEVGKWLERLTIRDGLTFDEAYAVLERRHGLPLDRESLERLHASFRRRTRPRSISDAGLANVAASYGEADYTVVTAEGRRLLTTALQALHRALQELEPEDRLILQLRFKEGRSIADVGRSLQLNSKHLYRRLIRLLNFLRVRIEMQGVRGSDVLRVLGSIDVAA